MFQPKALWGIKRHRIYRANVGLGIRVCMGTMRINAATALAVRLTILPYAR